MKTEPAGPAGLPGANGGKSSNEYWEVTFYPGMMESQIRVEGETLVESKSSLKKILEKYHIGKRNMSCNTYVFKSQRQLEIFAMDHSLAMQIITPILLSTHKTRHTFTGGGALNPFQ